MNFCSISSSDPFIPEALVLRECFQNKLLRSEVLKTVNIETTAFRDVMRCSLADKYRCFGITCCHFFYPEDGGRKRMQPDI
jgi:hypothetical protein